MTRGYTSAPLVLCGVGELVYRYLWHGSVRHSCTLLRASIRHQLAEVSWKSSNEQADILQYHLFSVNPLQLCFLERKGVEKQTIMKMNQTKFPQTSGRFSRFDEECVIWALVWTSLQFLFQISLFVICFEEDETMGPASESTTAHA